MYYQVIEKTYANAKYNAGSKARTDAYAILDDLGFSPLEMAPHDETRATAGKVGKLLGHIKAARGWKKILRGCGEGDVVFLQLPIINHSIFLEKAFAGARKRGVKIIALVHDLEQLRLSLGTDSEAERLRYEREGAGELRISDILIVHNDRMKAYLTENGMPEEKVAALEIFDYLLDAGQPMAEAEQDIIAIAGNLKKEKSGYIYKLPESPEFYLFGKGYEPDEAENRSNVIHKGAFAPDEPGALSGAYGLVWDGESIDTCAGVNGQYLKYNAPHKTSLYLACGMPVIIWAEAAMADFIKAEGVGLTAGSLGEISQKISAVSDADYETMREKAAALAVKLRSGYFLRMAVNEAIDRLGGSFDEH